MAGIRNIRVNGLAPSILTCRIDEIVEDGILVFPRSLSDKASNIASAMLFADKHGGVNSLGFVRRPSRRAVTRRMNRKSIPQPFE